MAVPATVRAGAVVCHPHPQYGGDRFDNVVAALYGSWPALGIATLRFDFRPEFSDGIGERLDASAALDELEGRVGKVPVVMAGYSFGAWVAAGLTDDRITAIVLVAPPLAVMPPVPGPSVPTLVLTPEHDQFSPPAGSAPIIAEWNAQSTTPIDHQVVSMADHFLVGHTAAIATRTTTWLADHL